jgi:hypothetical protein
VTTKHGARIIFMYPTPNRTQLLLYWDSIILDTKLSSSSSSHKLSHSQSTLNFWTIDIDIPAHISVSVWLLGVVHGLHAVQVAEPLFLALQR